MFFHAYMYGPLQGKLRLYKARGVHVEKGVTMSADWEVFASMLVRDVGSKLGKGIDLAGHEVKSALGGGSFEYQYHKNSGLAKLRNDMRVGHLFFSHWDYLKRVEVRYVHGKQAKKEFFGVWLKKFPTPYPQRYRKQIPFGWVKRHGQLILELKDGEVVFPKPKSVGQCN